ncbi:hypothetical protein [uncultured Tissierella sp.]|uniref:hypothetical protein n=1 Tax=uncultured Tissierella sp. TaxID=448160 RepID=UPI00280554DC|nr:hypothetical protein [uncultured Tissierella sp.]MDU5081205.1 hypothetical protein [Bacillota bacterium]
MKKEKYDATYKLGDAIVHVVAPPPMSEEEKEKILDEFHQAGFEIWRKLSPEKKQELLDNE